MTFPRRLLTEGEEVVVELRPHWAFLGWPLVATVAAVALAVGIDIVFPHAPVGVIYVLLGAVAVTGLWLAGRTVRWMTTSLVLTTSRIVERSGVLARRALEIRLDRINELSYHQSLGSRIGRTGEVMVECGGEKGVVMFEHVPRPSAFQSLITEQMSAYRDGRRYSRPVGDDGPGAPHHADTPPHGVALSPAPQSPTSQSPAPLSPTSLSPTPDAPSPMVAATSAESAGAPSVADRLMQLGELRRRGIVSAAEFEAKKAELLEQL